ncbi:YbaK/EbsC family protein [Listeria cornellensis]|uniref:YbaK / prolyl-tRNA synthetases associated domain-containing protein n=1 Tax=Listeria cornellensis FSL F6-0969 TaxID=1265820 RepID=W7C9N3_9LIST|nr:ybaK / prolyl-tRNA synthetases associated domain-containing protein [Listeria cornellensis FSL F6-0969]
MKIPKTNVGRILDQRKIPYELYQIPFQDKHVDAVTVALDLDLPPDKIYKTLVTKGDKTGVVVACIPGNQELDLKLLAKASENKKNGDATNEGFRKCHRIHTWRLFTDWYEETVSNFYRGCC